MRSSKGTAQFLLMAFFILAVLVYITTKNADWHQAQANKTVMLTSAQASLPQ